MALTLSASGVAGLFVSRLINGVLTANGGNWRQGWTIVAGVSVLSSIIAFLFVKERPEDLGQLVDGGVGDRQSAGGRACNPPVAMFSWQPRPRYKTFS